MQKIYKIAETEKVFIAYDDLQRAGGIQGLYTIDPRAGPLIVLDLSLLSQPKLHRCIAAHELGHHFCPPRSNATTFVAFYRGNQYSTNSQIIVGQDEHRALKWATELLMPSPKVWAAIKDGHNTIPLLSDYFMVTEWFVRAKIGYMRREWRDRGRKLKWRDIIYRETTANAAYR